MNINKPDWWDEWTEFDEERLETVIKDNAPNDVLIEWHKLKDNLKMRMEEPQDDE
jgi:hypothetical protein